MPLQLKSLDYVVLIVGNLDASLNFYHHILGLPLRHRAQHYAQLDTGITRLGLFTAEAMTTTLGRPPASGSAREAFELGFFVDDCDAAVAELMAAGVARVSAPVDREWGQRTAYVSDPDGNLVELVEELT